MTAKVPASSLMALMNAGTYIGTAAERTVMFAAYVRQRLV